MLIFNVILVFLIVLAIFVVTWQASNLISVFFGSPYVGAPKAVIARALKLAKIKKGEVFYDLGCGKGETLIMASKYGAKVTGIEISPYYYIWSKIITLPYFNIGVKYRNIKNVDFSQADVIYCYLLPDFLAKLAPKFKKELKKSARVISISFQIPGLKLVKKTKILDRTVLIYSLSSRAA